MCITNYASILTHSTVDHVVCVYIYIYIICYQTQTHMICRFRSCLLSGQKITHQTSQFLGTNASANPLGISVEMHLESDNPLEHTTDK